MILVDTNILLRSSTLKSLNAPVIVQATARLLAAGEQLVVAPQSYYEMWVVLTRPLAQNGYELDAVGARGEVDRSRASFGLLTEPVDILQTWLELITKHAVKGKAAHDARLVALMICYGVNRILTTNTSDFSRYSEVRAISADDVLAGKT
ncbi:MAG TPA: PIN domain-containing protein [Phycisphaerae bacterium]|nr:PIN domain-containing protein [Phycisphaerae bacterium]